MVKNELLKKMIKAKIKSENAIENGNRLIDYNEAKDEIDRILNLSDEIYDIAENRSVINLSELFSKIRELKNI